jgi:hypothetical protein
VAVAAPPKPASVEVPAGLVNLCHILEFEPRDPQWKILASPARFKIVSAGRRFGKSEMAAVWSLYQAFAHPMRREKAHVWIVSHVYGNSDMIFDRLKHFAHMYLESFIVKENQSKYFIELRVGDNGEVSRIQCRSADKPDNLRGAGLVACVVEEAAQIDEYAYRTVLRPAFADKQANVLAISTPKRQDIWFREEYWKGDPENPDKDRRYESFSYTTLQGGNVTAEEVEDLVRDMSENEYEQEILAKFTEDDSSVFRGILDCVSGEAALASDGSAFTFKRANRSRSYVLGVDVAKYEDWTVIGVLDYWSRELVYFDRFRRIDWPEQKRRIVMAAKAYNNSRIVIDAAGPGDVLAGQLVAAGLRVARVKLTVASKPQLIQQLAIAIEQTQLRFPRIPVLIHEMRSYEYERTPSGQITTNARGKGHDDCVMMLALAWHGLIHSKAEFRRTKTMNIIGV